MAHRTDEDFILHEHNTARFFVENRQISWILLFAAVSLAPAVTFSLPASSAAPERP